MKEEISLIKNTINLYFTGTYEGDPEKLRQAFHPDAHIIGTIDKQEFNWTLSDFIARVTTQPTAAAKKEKYDKEIVSFNKTYSGFLVKARVVVGDRVFYDDIALIKQSGSWIIRNKRFTAEPQLKDELEEDQDRSRKLTSML